MAPRKPATSNVQAPARELNPGLSSLAAQARARRANTASAPANSMATGLITEPTKEERKMPDFWVNVGYTIKHPETGEDVFISLPVGINIDTMQERKLNASDPLVNQINSARNHLLNMLRDEATAMDAGTSVVLDFLEVQLLRRTEEGKGLLDANANPFILPALKFEDE